MKKSKVVGTQRGVPDVSAEADPNSGVWVRDSDNGGWYIVGGTSASSPIYIYWKNLISTNVRERCGNCGWYIPLGTLRRITNVTFLLLFQVV